MARVGIFFSLLVGLVFYMTVVLPAWGGYVPYNRKVGRITFSGTTAVINNELKGHWIASASRIGMGNITVTLEPSAFAGTPLCFCNTETNGGGCNVMPASATSLTVRLTDLNPVLLALTGMDASFSISCEYTEGP